MSVLLRLWRTTAPLATVIMTGALQSHPKTLWLLPVLAAAGKGLRDTWPGSKIVSALPF